MYRQRAFLLIAAAGLALVVSVVQATDSIPVAQLKTTVKDSSGTLVIVVSGTAPESNDWLGVSFYKPNYVDPIWDAQHTVYPMPKGDFTKSVAIPAELAGGTFEVALWKNKTAERWVYRLSTMRGYGSGTVKEGGFDYPASETISALKTSLGTKNGKTVLTISGSVADKEDWLGISFYKANYADPVLDADYLARTASQGKFALTIGVPEGFETGTYEVALWKNLDEKKEIYKLDTMLGYATGHTVKP